MRPLDVIPRLVGVERLRDAEVHDEDLLLGTLEHHVFGLDVAMDQAGFVGDRQRGRDFLDHPADFRNRQPAIAVEPLLERLALDERHHDVRDAARLADVIDGDDASMPERRDRLGLAAEPLQHGLIHHQLGREHLHRQLTLETIVTDRKDFSKSAPSNQLAYGEIAAHRLFQTLPHVHHRRGRLEGGPCGRDFAVRARPGGRRRSAYVAECCRFRERRMARRANELVGRSCTHNRENHLQYTATCPPSVKKSADAAIWRSGECSSIAGSTDHCLARLITFPAGTTGTRPSTPGASGRATSPSPRPRACSRQVPSRAGTDRWSP